MELVYSSRELILIGYTDFNFASDKEARKSIRVCVHVRRRGSSLECEAGLHCKLQHRGSVRGSDRKIKESCLA